MRTIFGNFGSFLRFGKRKTILQIVLRKNDLQNRFTNTIFSMRYFLTITIFLSLWTFQANAQPSPTSTLNFKIKVDSLVFKKGKSNFRLKTITGTNQVFYYTREFRKSDFKDDTLRFSVDVEESDTLAFDLINILTNKKMKVVVCGIFYHTFYQFDLKEFYADKDLYGAVYFDMREIFDLMKQSDTSEMVWKQCDIKKDKNSNFEVKVNDFGLRKRNGLMPYSWKKTQDKRFHDYYYDLDVQHFFRASPNSASGKFIYKNNGLLSGNSDKILAKYEYQRTQKDRRNKLFGHHSVYTFYEDHTFLVEVHNPPQEVSLTSEYKIGIGIWEIIDGIIILNSPANWWSIYADIPYTDPATFHNTKFKVKGKKLVQIVDSNRKYRLKKTSKRQINECKM